MRLPDPSADFTHWLAAQPEQPSEEASHAAFQNELADFGAGLAELADSLRRER